MGYSINNCRKIVLGGSSPKNIEKVIYCDNGSVPHVIWPCKASLTNVYLTELKSSNQSQDVSHLYTITNGEPNYYLVPGVQYAITGTVEFYSMPGVIDKVIDNCYFFYENLGTVNGAVADGHISAQVSTYTPFGSRIATNRTTNLPVQNSSSDIYHVFTADDTVGDVTPITADVGWWGDNVWIQNGFITDNNYVTPIILKRLTVYRGIRIYDNGVTIPTNSANAGITLSHKKVAVGDNTVISVKKFGYCANDAWFSDYENLLNPPTYDTSKATISQLANGQYNIVVTGAGINEITFSDAGASEKVIIHQSDISLSTNSLTAPYSGGRFTIDVTAFVGWTASVNYNTSETGWINLPYNSGNGSYNSFEIGVSSNSNSTSSRNATIVFTAQTSDITPETVSLNISQEGNANYSAPHVTAIGKNWYNDSNLDWGGKQSWQVIFDGGSNGNTWNNVSIKVVDPSDNNNTIIQLASNITVTATANEIVYEGLNEGKINNHEEANLFYSGATVDNNDYKLVVTSNSNVIAENRFNLAHY